MKYTKEYFINKFEAIPENKWMVGEFGNPQYAACALGHCGCNENMNGEMITEEGRALIGIIRANFPNRSVVSINDGINYKHLSSPKQRVLAALAECKE